MTDRELMQQALEALGPTPPECCGCEVEWQIAIDALRRALEQPAQQEPVTNKALADAYQCGFNAGRKSAEILPPEQPAQGETK